VFDVGVVALVAFVVRAIVVDVRLRGHVTAPVATRVFDAKGATIAPVTEEA
jgi:hypothetical protein